MSKLATPAQIIAACDHVITAFVVTGGVRGPTCNICVEKALAAAVQVPEDVLRKIEALCQEAVDNPGQGMDFLARLKVSGEVASYLHPYKTTHPYECVGCGAKGVKLWREIHGCDDGWIGCVSCVMRKTGKVVVVDEDGVSTDSVHGRSDQICGKIPAVPTEDGRSFYGYSSVPEPGCRWWKALPLLRPT